MYLTLHDVKMDLIRAKCGASDGDVDPSNVKAGDLQRCDEYCRLGLAMFTHFTSFYQRKPQSATHAASSSEPAVHNTVHNYLDMTLDKIDALACYDPDEGTAYLITIYACCCYH